MPSQGVLDLDLYPAHVLLRAIRQVLEVDTAQGKLSSMHVSPNFCQYWFVNSVGFN